MRVVNFTEARNNLKSIFDVVYHNSEEVIVNRKNGENVVIISLDTFNAMKETEYLLRSPNNAEHLRKSIQQYRDSKTLTYDLLD
ncbi:MAG TPA: type II toxin-antitoxin system prevent-host-death family antitoxin [Sulfurovum sp.]|jgi:antitoxin YefM|nr:MAG: prevent-host-death protein [Sulfurovum sp. 35-42-20]OYZ26328.1 MAG: prevent-host-death protein [Sulfurovum sp. 16-42-52]OYZ48802.1 MAG: prevent-host-death protein [Sulfurovum sp. 24-42-9]OZA46494.1 MAG: prevent-host-death protein [Sulfurovum sp. 17-42-90]OZA59086.1 MAG: prevent-host-death protein [Sulfurovum sp. 39-42-12]HQR74257.1 type II toxin-antitoxin system prevent-host-death family antitoxin [Sulfurovum sp.]